MKKKKHVHKSDMRLENEEKKRCAQIWHEVRKISSAGRSHNSILFLFHGLFLNMTGFLLWVARRKICLPFRSTRIHSGFLLGFIVFCEVLCYHCIYFNRFSCVMVLTVLVLFTSSNYPQCILQLVLIYSVYIHTFWLCIT